MSTPIANPAELVLPAYERGYGVHPFPVEGAVDSDPALQTVSVVSQPSWELFCSSIRASSRQSLGTIALGPELITFPDGLKAIPHQRELIEDRVNQLRMISLDYPETTFVFGTPTFDDSRNGSKGHRPSNSVLFVQKGWVLAQHNKQYPSLGAGEKDVFTFEQEETLDHTIDPSIAALVCSDIIGEAASDDTREMLLSGVGTDPDKLIGDDVRTVLLSSSWAYPIKPDPLAGDLAMTDGRFRNALEMRVGRFFEKHPNVREVIVADRVPAGITGIKDPYNARFTSRVKQP